MLTGMESKNFLFFYFMAKISSTFTFDRVNFSRHILVFSSYAPPKEVIRPNMVKALQ